MGKVTGIGGIFFKSRDPAHLKAWYRQNLGIEPDSEGHVSFRWREQEDPERIGYTVWEPFPGDTKYFAPSRKPYMFNFRVDDLDSLLAQLRAAGCKVDEKIEEYDYGRFGWVMDPEGNRLELWEPPVLDPTAESAPKEEVP